MTKFLNCSLPLQASKSQESPPLQNAKLSRHQAAKQKILHPEELVAKRQLWRLEGKQLATLNGSFDLLHAGHLEILYTAAQQGDILLVAINSDLSVRSYKDPSRPIIPLTFRMELLTALACVDYVTWFDEPDPRHLLSLLQPDVHVNGEEYGLNCIEAEVVRQGGGRLHLVPRIEGLSTSNILRTIQSLT